MSAGCVNCYAERQAARFSGLSVNSHEAQYHPFNGFVHIVNGHPAWTGKVELIESKLSEPLRWKKPRRVFVNSMSDLFHEALPDETIDRVFAVMALCPQHTFQVLTKRPERMLKYFTEEHSPYFYPCHRVETRAGDIATARGMDMTAFPIEWPLPNVWLGVSVEDQATADARIPLLLQTPAAIRFVSYEPALGPVDFSRFFGPQKMYLGLTRGSNSIEWGLDRNGWVIVGGESGPGARLFDMCWASAVIEQCKAAGVACFVKQIGARPFDGPHDPWSCHDKKGGDMDEWPSELRVREFPQTEAVPA